MSERSRKRFALDSVGERKDGVNHFNKKSGSIHWGTTTPGTWKNLDRIAGSKSQSSFVCEAPHINAFFSSMANQVIKKWKRPDFRPSSFPFCAIRHLAQNFDHKFAEPEKEGFSMNFYTEIGTAVHTVIQKFSPSVDSNRIKSFGVWECKSCKHISEPLLHPYECPACGSKYITYRELVVRYKDLSGHIDYVLAEKVGDYWMLDICDFKTTEGASDRIDKGWLPVPKHFKQLETYAGLLAIALKTKTLKSANVILADGSENKDLVADDEDNFVDAKIRSINIIYVERGVAPTSFDYIFSKTLDDKAIRRLMNRVHRDCVSYELVKGTIEKFKKDHTVSLTCNEANDIIRDLIATRPCKKDGDFAKYMSAGFFGNKKCQFMRSCECGATHDVEEYLIDVLSIGTSQTIVVSPTKENLNGKFSRSTQRGINRKRSSLK